MINQGVLILGKVIDRVHNRPLCNLLLFDKTLILHVLGGAQPSFGLEYSVPKGRVFYASSSENLSVIELGSLLSNKLTRAQLTILSIIFPVILGINAAVNIV